MGAGLSAMVVRNGQIMGGVSLPLDWAATALAEKRSRTTALGLPAFASEFEGEFQPRDWAATALCLFPSLIARRLRLLFSICVLNLKAQTTAAARIDCRGNIVQFVQGLTAQTTACGLPPSLIARRP